MFDSCINQSLVRTTVALSFAFLASVPRSSHAAGPDCGCDCDKPAPKCRRHHPPPAPDLASGVTGLRLSSTQVQHSDDDPGEPEFGLQFAFQDHSYTHKKWWSMRSAGAGWIGGGEAGFEGGISADGAGGLRLKLSENSATFLRLGLRGWIWGNNELYSSFLEIPQAQLGAHWTAGSTVLEIAGRSGAVLVGRYNTGDEAHRKLGGNLEVGGHVAAHWQPLHAELGYTRVLDDDGAVDMVTGSICGEAWYLALCTDGRYLRGKQFWADGLLHDAADSVYAGLSLGLRKSTLDQLHLHAHQKKRP